ncbi:ABC transporter permease [Flaviaesturariibacter terrae]
MKLFLATHAACFRAEWIKLKRTGLFWMGLGTALVIPLIMTIVGYFIPDLNSDRDAWNKMLETNIGAFGAFFYPLFLVITMVRLVYLEHKADTWKVLETQPVSRAALFLVKYEVALLVALLSLLLLVAFSLLGGSILQWSGAQSALASSKIDALRIAKVLLRYWIASLGIVALHYYIALLIRTFAWPLIIGLIGIIAGNSLADAGIWNWFPWSAFALTGEGMKGSPQGSLLLPHEWLAILWALLGLLFGYTLLTRRGFAAAHLRGRYAVFSGTAVAIFALAAWGLTRPQLMTRYNGTVIAGQLKSDNPVKTVALLRGPAQDTVLSGMVVNGSFHLAGVDGLAPDLYQLQLGSLSLPVYFGSRDSLFVAVTNTKEQFEQHFSGTRGAENEFLARERLPDFSSIERFGIQEPPAKFSRLVLNNLDGYTQKAERFHTVDNVRPAADFVAFYRKLCAVSLLRIVNIEYPKAFALYHPNEKLAYTPGLEELRREISLNDPSLAGQANYLQYVADYLRSRVALSPNRDSALVAYAQQQVTNPAVRDAFYLSIFSDRLQRLPDSSARASFVAAALPELSSPSYRRVLEQNLRRLNSLMRGRPAPDFASESGNGTAFRLDRFRGRYVVIDVWASWCGPCKRESPYFEEMAERFTDERVLFVALSVDEDRNDWRREIVYNTSRVLQLHVPDAGDSFLQPYGITTIPRYLLLDPQGRILNASLPVPSDPEFAAILQREIPFGKY